MHTRVIKGTTLLEVMVAMVIMAVGLLGLAGLQATGLNNNGNADKRTQATVVANDMIERMRANLTGVTAGNYAAVNYATIDCTVAPATYCQANGATAASDCTPAQSATFDAHIATCDARNRLTTGGLSVQCTDNLGVAAACAGNPFRTITVNWQNLAEGTGAVNRNLTLTFRP